ncbi:double-stranded RNA-binding protein Staufen homolog 2, partial [Lates japonicus]
MNESAEIPSAWRRSRVVCQETDCSSSAAILGQDLKKLPFIPAVEKPKTHYKKRTKTILKTGPDYGQGMNPISRLAQIQQAKKEKEPEYLLLSERGMPRRREFIMQVKVNNEAATEQDPTRRWLSGTQPRRCCWQLGYKAPQSLRTPPSPERSSSPQPRRLPGDGGQQEAGGQCFGPRWRQRRRLCQLHNTQRHGALLCPATPRTPSILQQHSLLTQPNGYHGQGAAAQRSVAHCRRVPAHKGEEPDPGLWRLGAACTAAGLPGSHPRLP